MNKVVAILSFVFVAGYILPEVSWADKHILAPSEDKRSSLMLAERDEFVGPVLRGESLSRPAEPSSWNRFSLTHTDSTQLFGRDPHPPGAYRRSQPADGVALMFGWPFERLPTFPMSTDAAPRERNLYQDNEMTNPYLR
mgnify:CR=1 FL=1